MALFCANVRAKIIPFAGPRAVPSMLSPYVLMNRIVGNNHITPAGSKIRGKRPHSAQMSRGSTDQWTGARNTTYAVMAAYLRGVLVAISIPIFSAQLEKAREATDQANIRNAYAEVTAACLADNKADDTTNQTSQIGAVTYDSATGTYSCTVTATQSDTAKWESGENVTIGGKTVKAGASWTISGTKNGNISITTN